MLRTTSLKFQIIMALGIQFVVLLLVVSITLYELSLRRHDYVILNLAGQLRVISQVMVNQSHNYLKQTPRSYASYQSDLDLYHKDLLEQIDGYSKIIEAFKQRDLTPELVRYSNLTDADRPPLGKVPTLLNGEEVIYCTWDAQSRSQLDQTAAAWEQFRHGLIQELGNPQAPHLEAGARYIQFNQDHLIQASADLALAFRIMMENKLNHIRLLNQAALGLSSLLILTILIIMYRKVFRPVDTTVQGFRRVAQGDLDYQVPVTGQSEISHLTRMFNELTSRLAAIFRLSDRITQASNLDETLQFVSEEFRGFLPIEMVALLRYSQEDTTIEIERIYSDGRHQLHEGISFDLKDCLSISALGNNKPLYFEELSVTHKMYHDKMIARFVDEGMQSLMFVPLRTSETEKMILVFGARENHAYHNEHLELLENIAAQVSHGFEKTIGMESLVISAVEGLAKLAESRDPETGDHLYRMSRYSALIAEELIHTEQYQSLITAAYIRDILRFSPMHDIGKVGVGDSILLKPGKLTSEERKIMQTHPVIGADVLKRCEQQVNAVGRSIFKIGIEIAESHHERYDGTGYPYGLKGDMIPLSARIVAVADVFDALTSRRPYKQAWSIEQAMEVIREECGKHFDPVIVDALERALPRVTEIYQNYKHI